MSGTQNGRNRNMEKPFPGCLGRMVNLFDLSTSVAGNRLLTDKPHHDGSPLSMGRSDAAWMSPTFDPIEDKVIVSELRRSSSSEKSNATPVKILIAQEMSKEVEFKCNPPSVVAKLMGLDPLPQQQHDSAVRRSHSRGYSQSHLDIPLDYWQREDGLDLQMQSEINHCQALDEYKDVYEIGQQSQKGCYARESPQKGRHNKNTNEKKMALVRQKFVEAKRLATDEKLRHSKQFQDALEVLSSNRDLFLNFLQEPYSLFSQHLCDLQSVPPPPETKRITVLRPSKMVVNNKHSRSGKKDEKQIKKASHVGELIGCDENIPGFPPPNWRGNDNATQPTRIVVLKPSPGKPHNVKAAVSPPPSSPRALHGQEFYGEREDDEMRESIEEAKDVTWQVHENLSGHRRDETLLSSVFSNDYIDDESSFNKSENDYAMGNINETEVVSPTSRHSWDYINRFGSPYSSSFSRASCSPESSVCREAKKRLSERWAMMASNENLQEQRPVRRSSSTLGEMLALCDTKNSIRSEEGSKLCLDSDLNKDENMDNSPRNLLRSKSLPVSSTMFGGRPNDEVSDPEVGKTEVPMEATKQRSVKSSFKGKVSSLFFSRSKKSSKEKSRASQSKDESKKSAGMSEYSTRTISSTTSRFGNNSGIEEGSLATLQGSSSKTSSPHLIGMGPTVISPEAGLSSVIKPAVTGNPSENQDQPSPISVLEAPFEEDDNKKAESCNANADPHGAKLPADSIKSNLIDKSPPIGSIARTLSWCDSCVETATLYPLKPSMVSRGKEEEEQEWLFFVQSLLSAAGLDGEVESDSFFVRWHSPESLLDPSLRDTYIDSNDKEIMHEAKRRQMRSMQKLVFDCVNAALVEITGYGSETTPRAIIPCGGVHSKPSEGGSPMLVDQVWACVKGGFSGEVGCFSGDGGFSYSLVVERVARKEVVGNGWVEQRRLEMENFGKEIEEKLLEELVQEAVVDLIGGVC